MHGFDILLDIDRIWELLKSKIPGGCAAFLFYMIIIAVNFISTCHAVFGSNKMVFLVSFLVVSFDGWVEGLTLF